MIDRLAATPNLKESAKTSLRDLTGACLLILLSSTCRRFAWDRWGACQRPVDAGAFEPAWQATKSQLLQSQSGKPVREVSYSVCIE